MILLPFDSWEVKKTKKKGRGIFAKKDIPAGTIIGDYLGKVIHPRDAVVDEENFYLMYYHDRAVVVPDLQKQGVHLLNHACTPNTFLYIYKGHTLAFALREISSGEELNISYLLAPLDKFCQPCKHECDCGGLQCLGTMHLSKDIYERWRRLTDAQSKETKRERIRYGRDLPKLSSYPNKISIDYIKKINALFNLN